MSSSDNGSDEMASLSLNKLQPQTLVSPRSVTALILRMRALVSEWLKAEVDEDSIQGADGLITDGVVRTFLLAGGDLCDAVPYALLESRKSFLHDAYHQTGTLNRQRALACEVLARKTVCQLENLGEGEDRSKANNHICLSKRFVRLDEDGDKSLPTSAMETAADQNCVIFLSSPEAQKCAEDLWKGSEYEKRR
jgi:hypothetical protein